MATKTPPERGTARWATMHTAEARARGPEPFSMRALARHKTRIKQEAPTAFSQGGTKYFFQTSFEHNDALAAKEVCRMLEELGYEVTRRQFPRGGSVWGLAFEIKWPDP